MTIKAFSKKIFTLCRIVNPLAVKKIKKFYKGVLGELFP